MRNQSNRYLQDREEMKAGNFAGMGPQFFVHDAFATETQGPIQDRSRENLGNGDVVIAGVRRMMREAMETVQKGGRPPNLLAPGDDPTFPHLVVVNAIVGRGIDKAEHVRRVIAEESARRKARTRTAAPA